MNRTHDVNELMNEISVASNEQSKGINQASSAENLKRQAAELNKIVGELNLIVKGAKESVATDKKQKKYWTSTLFHYTKLNRKNV